MTINESHLDYIYKKGVLMNGFISTPPNFFRIMYNETISSV